MDIKTPINHMSIDTIVVNLLQDCYNHSYADISSHFYQLAVQALHSEPNITGPMKPFTGKVIMNRATGKAINVTKKVDVPAPQELSIWVIRGFYPNTGVPYKLTVYRNENSKWGLDYTYTFAGAKVSLGTFNRGKDKVEVNVKEVKKYIEEFSERVILGEETEDMSKPEVETASYRTMTPKGLTKQAGPKRRCKKK